MDYLHRALLLVPPGAAPRGVVWPRRDATRVSEFPPRAHPHRPPDPPGAAGGGDSHL